MEEHDFDPLKSVDFISPMILLWKSLYRISRLVTPSTLSVAQRCLVLFTPGP